MTDIETALISALNLFCFQKIWNEPTSELRANIIPSMVQPRSITGNVSIGAKTIALPTNTDPYYVYVIPSTLMHVFSARQVPSNWISGVDLCNKYDILLYVYHLNGKMIHKGSIFIKRDGSRYILAVDKKMSQKCLLFSEMKDLRLTMYFDSDFTNKMEVRSYKVPPTDSNFNYRRQIYDYIADYLYTNEHTTVYVNGYETVFENINTFPENAYIDILHDSNNIFSFDIDLTDVKNNVAFYSNKDETYKQLVHIPKSLNPDNKILTHNTCDIYVRQKLENGKSGKGLYLHRCAARGVDQVTHNDISIPMFIVDAYRDTLNTQEISLHLKFRQHDKDNVLLRDKNYIDLLYTLDDELIIQHLLGNVQENLSFWKASNLEQSTYVKMMFDVPNIITKENMIKYVDGLGYYHVMALLCKKIVHSTVLAWYDSGINIPKPYLFMTNLVYPFVYLNEKKISHVSTRYTNIGTTNLRVGINENIPVIPGDRLTVEMFVDGDLNIYKMSPTVGNTEITVPYTDLDILEEFDISDTPVKAFDLTGTKSYRVISTTDGNVGMYKSKTSTRIVFGPNLYGRNFIIQNRKRVYKWEKNLDSILENGNPIFLNLHYPVKDAGYEAPILKTPHVRVYLNGKYLIQGIDFSIKARYDHHNRLSTKQILVNSLEYLLPTGNKVEWFATSGIEENEVHGYVVDNKAAVPEELALLFENMSMVHVDGKYEQGAFDLGNMVGIPDNGLHRQGAPFQICTVVPELVHDFLSEYHPNTEIDRLKILNEYFYGRQPILDPIVVLPQSHRCYSPYVVMIIRDILNDTLKGISYDPDESRMKDQFKSYEFVKNSDLVHSGQYDLNYVDVYPHYKQIIVQNPNVYKVLQAFIRITMPKDTVTSGEVYYDN